MRSRCPCGEDVCEVMWWSKREIVTHHFVTPAAVLQPTLGPSLTPSFFLFHTSAASQPRSASQTLFPHPTSAGQGTTATNMAPPVSASPFNGVPIFRRRDHVKIPIVPFGPPHRQIDRLVVGNKFNASPFDRAARFDLIRPPIPDHTHVAFEKCY